MLHAKNDVLSWIDSFGYSTPDRTLDHLHEILTTLGKPHLSLKSIHVAGTNGKGSTVAFIRDILMANGLKVATFTSPYITTFGERMSINKIPMSDENLVRYANLLKDALTNTGLTPFASFDIITLISFLYFKDQNPDIVIYETGIGGRLDSTNVITPLASVITNVGHDHMEILGETAALRASEKLGIVKKGIPLFTAEEDPVLRVAFEKKVLEKEATIHHVLDEAQFEKVDEEGTHFYYKGQSWQVSMHGEHQFKNASLALAVCEYLEVPEDAIKKGLRSARWQGRFEYIQKKPPIILDGAHNLEGIDALVKTIKDLYPERHVKIMFSAIATKDASMMIDKLATIANEMIFTKGMHPASIAPEVLYEMYDGDALATFEDEFELALKQSSVLDDDEVLIVCGSLYFISDVRNYLLKDDAE